MKMVHNGIEYGMMQALAEGFAVMKASGFDLDLAKIADLAGHRGRARVPSPVTEEPELHGKDHIRPQEPVRRAGGGETVMSKE